jgi:hypothetical protein
MPACWSQVETLAYWQFASQNATRTYMIEQQGRSSPTEAKGLDGGDLGRRAITFLRAVIQVRMATAGQLREAPPAHVPSWRGLRSFVAS